MKRFLLVLVLFAIIATGTVFADHPKGFGIGVMGTYGGGWGGGLGYSGAALSLKLPSVPVFWGINLYIHNDYLRLGVIGDYYLIDQSLIPTLSWFLGVGGWLTLGLGDNMDIAFGARLPIGLSWQPIPLLELFIDVAPSLGIALGTGGYVHFPAGGWQGEAGIRLWL